MNVLHILPNIHRGGAERAILNLIDSFDDDSIDFEILTRSSFTPAYEFATNPKLRNISILNHNRGPFVNTLSLFKWLFINRDYFRKFDVINGHLTFGAQMLWILKLNQFLFGTKCTKFIFSYHLSGMKVNFLIKNFQLSLLFFVDNFVYVANENNRFFDFLFFRRKSKTIIASGVKFQKINSNLTNNIYSLDRKNRIQFRIATLSRLNRDRSPYVFLDLFKKIIAKDADNQFTFILAGDGPLLKNLQIMAEKYEIAHRIGFPGLIRDSELFLVLSIFTSL